MPATKAEVKAHKKYNEKTYDRIGFYVPKGFREELKEYAATKGMSTNEYVNYLIKKDMGLLDE